MAPGEVGVGGPSGHDLDVAVEVAVGTLGRGHQPDGLVGGRRQGRVRGPPELPADRLQPLVDVGVKEGEDGPGGVGRGPVAPVGAGGQPEVVQGPGALQLVEAVGDGVLALGPLVTYHFPLEEVDLAFAALTAADGGAVKILVHP
jgi:hypothetical protein